MGLFMNKDYRPKRLYNEKKGENGEMKPRSISWAIVVGSICFGVYAAPQEACKLTVRNASGTSIGRIDSDGTIRNKNGSTIGRFKEGKVRDSSGSTIGRVDANGAIRNRSGTTIGRLDANGKLRDNSGTSVGRIDSDGTVRNRSGTTVGRFDGYFPACRYEAAAYLFFFEPLYYR
jgi:hypothetical protein